MGEPYKATFPPGSRVRVIQKAELELFARNWRYHHRLRPEQMEYAGKTAIVKEVTFYHGGDQLYVLEDVPGIWNEPCLERLKIGSEIHRIAGEVGYVDDLEIKRERSPISGADFE